MRKLALQLIVAVLITGCAQKPPTIAEKPRQTNWREEQLRMTPLERCKQMQAFFDADC